jgi:outer membrane protein assembly factor BamA
MPTRNLDGFRPAGRRCARLARLARIACALFALLAAWPAPALAQVRVDAFTEVRSIRFVGVHSLHEQRLRESLRTRSRPSMYGLRVVLGKLPFVSGPSHRPFSPLVLQEDVVRLRGVYRASGFLSAQIRYDVERDDEENLLDITFVIEEGRPLMLVDVSVSVADSVATLPVAPDERESWEGLERSLHKMRGKRLNVEEAQKRRDQLAKWWQDRGYPLAAVRPEFAADSIRAEARLAYRVSTGQPARFGEVRVEGNEDISEATVRRLVRIEPGAPYSAEAIEEARQNLEELDIVRVATVDIPSLAPVDSSKMTSASSSVTPANSSSVMTASSSSATPADSARATPVSRDSLPAAVAVMDSVLPVRVRITEADRRLVSGDFGYVTDGGISTQARWAHRNFTGGARTLTISGIAQTGWLALDDDPDERYRLSVSLEQPAAIGPRISALLTPFIEHRDDVQDRSTQYGVNTTLVYRFRRSGSVSLDYQIARRDIEEYRFGDLASGEIDLLTFLTQVAQGVLDSLGTTLETSTFTLSGTGGRLDDPANPRRGYVVRPAVQVSAPTSLSSTAYWRVDATGNGFTPLGRSAVIATRVRVGRMFPFGKSLPAPDENPDTKFLQLRDVTFTGGGSGDVRGWEDRLLGPKVPDVRFETVGDSLVPNAEGYVPLGGFARATFSVELQLPMPGLGKNFGSHAFLDGGRVWTDDARFGMEGDPNDQEDLFFATGAGLDLRTPVGPIKMSLGYKLNPSLTDLVDADELTLAAAEGRPLSELKHHNSRRWHLHLSIGVSY